MYLAARCGALRTHSLAVLVALLLLVRSIVLLLTQPARDAKTKNVIEEERPSVSTR